MKRPTSDDGLALLGRIFIAVLFLPAALGKLTHFDAITQAVGSKGLPAAALCAALVIALELFGSVALVVGWRMRWTALALAAFTLVAGMLFHDFWNAEGAAVMTQNQAFFKNIGIVGGLLLLAARGPGRLSLDARTARSPAI